MNKLMKHFIIITLLITVAAFVYLVRPVKSASDGRTAAETPQQQSSKSFVVTYPTGGTATFPKPLEQFDKNDPPIVYVRLAAAGSTGNNGAASVWYAASEIADDAAGGNTRYLSFTVPQLPSGRYAAFFQSAKVPGDIQRMEFDIEAKLFPREAILKSYPGEEISIDIGIDSAYVSEKKDMRPEQVSLPVKLRSLNVGIADISKDQDAVQTTDRVGFAHWRIKLNKEGTVEFIAEAEGYRPTIVRVICEPKATVKEIEQTRNDLKKARIQVAATLIQADIQEEQVNRLELYKTASSDIKNRQTSSQAQANPGIKDSYGQTAIDNSIRLAEHQYRGNLKAYYDARETEGKLVEKLADLSNLPFSYNDLKPGDIILVTGVSTISMGIQLAERFQLGADPPFSHAALYVGKISGRHVVAEMLDNGYNLKPIEDSLAQTLSAVVYRLPQLSEQKRNEIAAAAANLCGPAESALSANAHCRKYASMQIAVLVIAATVGAVDVVAIQAGAFGADIWEKGERRMICSELVAWAYYKAGVPLKPKKWWSLIETSGILNTDERRRDYTTPNMLSGADTVILAGRLR